MASSQTFEDVCFRDIFRCLGQVRFSLTRGGGGKRELVGDSAQKVSQYSWQMN